ncbi:MAG: GPP34 family phosphoprotein, partial [Actinomycetales bacterium]|nr:GPP34 family phosphoprotein [Actinomycetales bacterium]
MLDEALTYLAGRRPAKPQDVLAGLAKGLRESLLVRLTQRGILHADEGKILGIFPPDPGGSRPRARERRPTWPVRRAVGRTEPGTSGGGVDLTAACRRSGARRGVRVAAQQARPAPSREADRRGRFRGRGCAHGDRRGQRRRDDLDPRGDHRILGRLTLTFAFEELGVPLPPTPGPVTRSGRAAGVRGTSGRRAGRRTRGRTR